VGADKTRQLGMCRGRLDNGRIRRIHVLPCKSQQFCMDAITHRQRTEIEDPFSQTAHLACQTLHDRHAEYRALMHQPYERLV